MDCNECFHKFSELIVVFLSLQGVEVIINASSLEDIDPMAIGQRLTNGTAAVASPIYYNSERGHLCVSGLQREEEMRKEEEKKKLAEERQRFEEERMELERKEQENREKRYRERERQIEEHRMMVHREAKAIIAQRSGNPREFFKQKERAMTISVDTSPLFQPTCIFILSPSALSFSTHFFKMKLFFLFSSDSVPKQEQKPPVQESTPTKPVQSVAPQARDSSAVSACESGTDSLVDLWDGSSAAPTNVAQPAQSSQSSNLVDLMGDVLHDNIPPSTAAASGRPQPLLSFDEMMDGTFCSGTGAEDDPSSLVDVTGSDQMTLSYQHALQHASGEGQELDDGQLLMTNGEALLKEGTQASEGYFSQSQEEEFGTSEESSAKPAPVFYNKPPEIDITCWDTDPVVDDEDD
uniref:Drebrin-like n=1 Tax=Neolamprologus brichardi TaxID=32507 RepID=A0A3Q4HDA8_NEOBR